MKTRTEHEMLELIVGVAAADPEIRCVVLEGSRANPNAAKDPFQDYDVIYAVNSIEPYKANLEWIKRFGELMILQMPDGMGEGQVSDQKFTYLMQFVDGNRIDLNLYVYDYLKQHQFLEPYKVLLDKESFFTKSAETGEAFYYPKPPTEKEFADCCNEFWWVAPYVAKGLWRDDLSYARHMFEGVLRAEAMKMLNWYFGIKTNFAASPGKYGRHFHLQIEPELLARLTETYANADGSQSWKALGAMCDLFARAGKLVATHFKYSYPNDDDHRVSDYLIHIQNLPKGAQAIY